MSGAQGLFPVPVTPFARGEAATFLHTTGTAAGAPGGNERSWLTPPADTQIIVVGQDQGQRFRGVDLICFSTSADNTTLTIPEIGAVERLRTKLGIEADAALFLPMLQDVVFTVGTKAMSTNTKDDLGLTGTVTYCDQVSITTKTPYWTILNTESSRDPYTYSPADNTVALLRIPFTADTRAIYVYRGAVTGFGLFARPYGGR